ncbi:SLIT and NTRK-like protein 2 [Monodelphis domestica]|uniref:SLIT and NTRK-like protein 2 n=1 Tax=Monodelphis domestica TaxID=13616 RepID=UPI0024E20907|nr:SLIT and NTRK-like protein 2 [Monodelphis domestica]
MDGSSQVEQITRGIVGTERLPTNGPMLHGALPLDAKELGNKTWYIVDAIGGGGVARRLLGGGGVQGKSAHRVNLERLCPATCEEEEQRKRASPGLSAAPGTNRYRHPAPFPGVTSPPARSEGACKSLSNSNCSAPRQQPPPPPPAGGREVSRHRRSPSSRPAESAARGAPRQRPPPPHPPPPPAARRPPAPSAHAQPAGRQVAKLPAAPPLASPPPACLQPGLRAVPRHPKAAGRAPQPAPITPSPTRPPTSPGSSKPWCLSAREQHLLRAASPPSAFSICTQDAKLRGHHRKGGEAHLLLMCEYRSPFPYAVPEPDRLGIKMLNGVWFLSVLTVAGILQTESRKTGKDICKIRCLCEEKENVLNINCENKELQYLYLEYNIIKEIKPCTFDALINLQLLFLNNNLLRALPENVFGGTALTRLNLRNNHFSHLPVKGVLDQLPAFIQIDLQENPWDCTCDIMGLKDWTEHANSPVIINEITCESPAKHAGEILKFLGRETICPDNPGLSDATILSMSHNTDTPRSLSVAPSSYPELHTEVPLSVLILGLLVVFILSVCFGAGLFVFVLKRRKGVPSGPSSTNNLDISSFQLQYGSYNADTADKTEGHVYNYIPPPVGQMCQNPIYMQKEGDPVAYYRNLQEFSYGNLETKKEGPTTLAYTISASELLEKQSTPREPELLYQNIAERVKELPSAGVVHYNFCTLPKRQFAPSYESRRQNQDRLNKTVLYGTPRKYFADQSKPEHPLLQAKQQTEPDYLEVLEKQTAISQL